MKESSSYPDYWDECDVNDRVAPTLLESIFALEYSFEKETLTLFIRRFFTTNEGDEVRPFLLLAILSILLRTIGWSEETEVMRGYCTMTVSQWYKQFGGILN